MMLKTQDPEERDLYQKENRDIIRDINQSGYYEYFEGLDMTFEELIKKVEREELKLWQQRR